MKIFEFDWLFGPKMVFGWQLAISLGILDIIQLYLFKDWGFLLSLVIIVLIDTLLGVWKAWKRCKLSSSKFAKFFTKTVIYALFLITVHVLTSFPIEGMPNGYFSWFKHVAYTALMAREALSIVEHMAYLSPGLIPEWITRKLKDINDDGKLNDSSE